MEVRIGVTYSAREIEVDLGEGANADAIQKDVESALSNSSSVFWLTDKKGRRVGIPSDKIAYVEIGSASAPNRIGFIG